MSKKEVSKKVRPAMSPIYISRAAHRKLKIYAVTNARTMSAILEECINKVVAGK